MVPATPLLGKGAERPGAITGEKLDKAHADLKKAAQGFESYFIHQMLAEMRKSIPKDETFGDSDHQQEIFQDMSDQAVADSAAKTGSFGIANQLYQELSKSLPPNNPDGVADQQTPSPIHGASSAQTGPTASSASLVAKTPLPVSGGVPRNEAGWVPAATVTASVAAATYAAKDLKTTNR